MNRSANVHHPVSPLLTACIVFLVLSLACGTPALAAVEGTGESQKAGTEKPVPAGASLCVNGLRVDARPEPVLAEGGIMIPLRVVSEFLGLDLVWDERTSSARGSWAYQELEIPLGKDSFRYAGQEHPLPLPTVARDGALLVCDRLLTDLFACKVDFDGTSNCVNVTLPPTPAEVWGFYALGSAGYSSWSDLFGEPYPGVAPTPPADRFTAVVLGWFTVTSTGSVSDRGNDSGFNRPDGWPAVLMQCKARGISVYAMFYSNNAEGGLSALLADQYLRERTAREIERSSREFDGVAIDFEGLGASQETAARDGENLTHFLRYLRSILPPERSLVVALPPVDGHYQGYDHRAVGEVADRVILMAYGYEEHGKPGPTAPGDRVASAVAMETQLLPPDKLVLGVPLYGTVYCVDETTGSAALRSRPAMKSWSSVQGRSEKAAWEPDLACWVHTWTDNTTTCIAYTELPSTLIWRLPLVRRYGLAGIAFWRLGLAGADGLQETLQYIETRSPSRPGPLSRVDPRGG